MPAHSHRAGPLRQSNKRNKRSVASKRSKARIAGAGRTIDVSSAGGGGRRRPGRAVGGKAKADRIHAAKQRREAARRSNVDAARRRHRDNDGEGSGTAPVAGRVPRVVGIVSLSEREGPLESSVRQFLLSGADGTTRTATAGDKGSGRRRSVVTAKFGAHKRDGFLTVLTNSGDFVDGKTTTKTTIDEVDAEKKEEEEDVDGSVEAALDLCRVCDVVAFCLDASDAAESLDHSDAENMICERGERVLTAVKAQGLPATLTVLVHSEGRGGGGDGGDHKGGMDVDCDGSLSTMSVNTGVSSKTFRRSALKKRSELKRFAARFAASEFGEDAKAMEIDLPVAAVDDDDEDPGEKMATDEGVESTGEDHLSVVTNVTGRKSRKLLPPSVVSHPSKAFVRALCASRASPARWVSDAPRPYLLSESTSYDAERKELKLTGYVRGGSGSAPLDANALMHVPGLGTFGASRVERATTPPLLSSEGGGAGRRKDEATAPNIEAADDADPAAVVVVDPSRRESLDMFANPDALEGEQNLIGFDEGDEEEEHEEDRSVDDGFQKGDERPAGWSDYQSAWLDGIDPDSRGAEDEDDDARDHGELAFALNQKSLGASSSVSMDLDDGDADDVTAEERKALLEQRRRDQKEERDFPDEVELKEDEKARDRFARYRSLKSFRKSRWDPKENLPESYASVYHLSSFRATQRDVLADRRDVAEEASKRGGRFWGEGGSTPAKGDEMTDDSEGDDLLEGCIPSGSYVVLTLENVPPAAYATLPGRSLPVAVALLPHENKASVLHCGLTSTANHDVGDEADDADPVKSKDVLTFRCGWRTWKSRPVFSQHNLNSNKHKFERYLPPAGSYFAASCFGPITYAPCPVLVFRDSDGGGATNGGETRCRRRELVATGSMLGADADRIVVKRIVLTGYPTRVHKRHATVKYMFYDPEDVKWFKPAGLTTKHGLQGNITESVGDHGTMKCLFNAPIKQHDTVCLPLYKRIYPKYAPADALGEDGVTTVKKNLVVL